MKIRVERAHDLPSEFVLVFAGPKGGLARLCCVVRRTADGVGVTYERETPTQAAHAIKMRAPSSA